MASLLLLFLPPPSLRIVFLVPVPMMMPMYSCGYTQTNLVINRLHCSGHVHSILFVKCWDFTAIKSCQGCTYGICLDFVAKGCKEYLQYFWLLDFVKHESIGQVTDDGSHGEEGGGIGYRRQSSQNGRGLSYRPSLW